MPETPNLDIPHLLGGAEHPEDVVNAALDALDAKITGKVVIDMGPSNAVVLTQDEQALGSIFVVVGLSPGPSAAYTVTFAAFGMGLFSIYNDTSEPGSFKVAGQPLPAPSLNAGERGIFQCDGVNVVRLV